MSEYQYYEFAAIDRPLNQREMAELRAVSPRAVITPGSFVNHYEWGDLKANPTDWMRITSTPLSIPPTGGVAGWRCGCQRQHFAGPN